MNKEKYIGLWKEKTKGLFLITEYKNFWKYFDNLRRLEEKYEEAIKYIISNLQYDENIDDGWVTTNELLKILQGDKL